MGGTTSVTLRKPDGEEFRMTRWTNSMPWGICNAKMFNSDEAHIDAYLEQWLLMKADYEANKDTGEFEVEMTECYFPGEGLVPCGYGLTVVDHVNKVILDMQGYTSFHNMTVAGIALEMNLVGAEFRINADPDSDFTRMREFIDSDRLLGVTTMASYNAGREYDEIESLEIDDMVPKIWGGVIADDKWFQFIIDTKPFTIERFEECDSLETARMYARLKELNFTFSEEEDKAWAEYIKEQKEDEEYDE